MSLSAVSVLSLAAGLLGLLNYRQAQLMATVIGPVVALLAVPAAWKSAWRGDRVGRHMLLGWCIYVAGALATTGLLRGPFPANVWTLHLYQAASLVEMLVWFRVLGLRIEALRPEAERQAETVRNLSVQASTDALTGLPNRRGLEVALADALSQAHDTEQLAVLLLDLDGFKAVNDQLGHEAGDRLLAEAAPYEGKRGGRMQVRRARRSCG